MESEVKVKQRLDVLKGNAEEIKEQRTFIVGTKNQMKIEAMAKNF